MDDTTVTGFRVIKYTVSEGKKEDDSGKVQITLEAVKDKIRVSGEDYGEYNLGDIISALNMHQVAMEPVVLKVRFPD